MSDESNEKECSLQAGLYLVATPIGNLGDISLRALDVLKAADQIYCEDTRVSKKLLSHFGISKKLRVYHDHSDEVQRVEIVRQIAAGESVALISDAGMPLISDPGYKLVQEAQAAKLNVSSVPGASAPLAALQLSGLPSDQFSFLGFLPSKGGARQKMLGQWKDVPGTLVMFETAPRLQAAINDIGAVLGMRQIAVVREITKKFEEVQKGTPEQLLSYYEHDGLPRGEIVIVVGPACEKTHSEADVQRMLKVALERLGTKDAAAQVADQTGLSKKELYAKILEMLEDEPE